MSLGRPVVPDAATGTRSFHGSQMGLPHANGLSLAAAGALVLLGLGGLPARAATLPPGFAETAIGGLNDPTAMAIAPDGRIFVCQQAGALRVIKNGALLPTPFLTLSVQASGERGLLGIAFDPDFASNQYLYVYYTTSTAPLHNRVSRFTANGDVVVPGSELVILDLDDLSSATNHNGGALHFGPDGKLYVAVGENATASNAQTLANLLGKMLRINADPLDLVPPDNPFVGTATGNNQAIWALGLRNPFTFAFQRGTGRMLVNDVGAVTWEEVNEGVAGSNYGWPVTEGPTTDPRFRGPLLAYTHSAGACAITGGTFYDPATLTFPAQYVGKYFYADYCAGWIRWLDPTLASPTANGFATGISLPVDLKVSAGGDLYYLARGSDAVFRVRYTAVLAPSITSHPADATVAVDDPATFTVAATGAAPLAYQWQRDGADVPGANQASYTLPAAQPADDGSRFRCVVTNAHGSATSNEALLTVSGNRPVGTITLPDPGTTYAAGDTIEYAGTATDVEDGVLDGPAFTWEVVFHHASHTHPFLLPVTGASGGTFTIPTSGETDADVWYRIHLTVADSSGLTHTSFRDVTPRTAVLGLASVPSGLQIRLDGQPRTTPHSVASVVGMTRSLEAVSPQKPGDTTWVFESWSDGGAAGHAVSTPATDTTYSATFRKARAQLTSPAPGGTLAGSVVAFGWTPGTGVERYWLELGTTPGGTQVHAGSPLTATSTTVPGIPADGSTVYARLWSRIAGVWELEDYTYTASGAPPVKAALTAPVPGSTLASTVVTFGWTPGSGVAAYWLEVGTTQGGTQISAGSRLTATSTVVSGLPADASTVFARLWSLIGSTWVFADYQYVSTSAPTAKAEMISPAPGSTFGAVTVTFTWTAGTGVAAYWLEVGTTPGGKQISAGARLTTTSTIVGGLPADASPVYARLWSLIGGTWVFDDYQYVSSGAPTARAEMVGPAPGTTLADVTVTFTWTAGTGVSAYWLEVGTTPGGTQVSPGSRLTTTSTVVGGLPADGRTVHVRLWSLLGSAWVYLDYTYTAQPPTASSIGSRRPDRVR